jgi:hypothetical protein
MWEAEYKEKSTVVRITEPKWWKTGWTVDRIRIKTSYSVDDAGKVSNFYIEDADITPRFPRREQ